MMSISERERQTLESIEDRLARSAPKLASMLSIFTRLTASEKMPPREPVRRFAGIAAGHQALVRTRRRPYPTRAARQWLWLVAAIALLVLVVFLGRGTSRSPCVAAHSTSATCAQVPAPVHPGAARPGGPPPGE
jgi:DUF3040 family protein